MTNSTNCLTADAVKHHHANFVGRTNEMSVVSILGCAAEDFPVIPR